MRRAAVSALVLLCHVQAVNAQQPDTVTQSVERAKQAAVSWLKLVDAGDYAGSWDSAAPGFQKALSKDSWVKTLLNTRRPLEPLSGRRFLGANYVAGPMVIVEYEVATGGSQTTVIERVVPARDTIGAWRVAGYFIRPSQ